MSRGRLLSIAIGALAVLCALAPAAALGARVLVLGPGGQVRVRDDPYLSQRAFTPAPALASSKGALMRAPARPRRRLTPAAALVSLRQRGAITPQEYAHYRGDLRQAAGSLHRLSGTRRAELGAVIQNLFAIAAAGGFAPSRLPALFLTLERNRQWWTQGPLPAPDQRVEFDGSQLVWEYYPGQGVELQQLGSFGKADGLYAAGPSHYAALQALLAQLIPLAVDRAGGLAWEYYFQFDGGRPPWISAMAQGTAIEALTRGYESAAPYVSGAAVTPAAGGEQDYLALAHRALAPLTQAPPSGVSLSTPLGRRFLQYSFAPGASIINAFLQTLIGLYDYAHVSGDPLATQLFAGGNAEAEAEVPQFDTGAWSLYQPGQEDTLSYHELVTGFLAQLCERLDAPVYCSTAQRFTTDLTTPPALTLLTTRARRRHAFSLRFSLSKYSHVGVVVVHNGTTTLLTSANFGYGTDAFAMPALKATGTYAIRLAATDLAGNFNRIEGTLTVTR